MIQFDFDTTNLQVLKKNRVMMFLLDGFGNSKNSSRRRFF